MKTAMREFFDNLESIDIKVPNGVKLIFIQKEKQQIIDAFDNGQANWNAACQDYKNGNEYYLKTLKKMRYDSN